jgi:hypothetical protein
MKALAPTKTEPAFLIVQRAALLFRFDDPRGSKVPPNTTPLRLT